MTARKRLWLFVLLLVGAALASPSAYSLQFNFISQATRTSCLPFASYTPKFRFGWRKWLTRASIGLAGELASRWIRAPSFAARLQADSIQNMASGIRVSVCYLPPFEVQPSMQVVGQLMGTIWSAQTFQPLWTYSSQLGCYTTPSSPTVCSQIYLVPSSSCSDADLFVNQTALIQNLDWLRGISGPLVGSQALYWSQLANTASTVLLELETAISLASSLSSTSDSFPLLRLAEDIASRSTTMLTSLNVIFSSWTSNVVTIESSLEATMVAIIQSYEADLQNQSLAISSAPLNGLSRFNLETNQAAMNQLISSFALTSLQMIGAHFKALQQVTSNSTQLLSAIASSGSQSAFAAYQPSALASNLNTVFEKFILESQNLLQHLKSAQYALSSWSPVLVGCYDRKLRDLAAQFNASDFLLSHVDLTQLLEATGGIQQEYGLFEADPMDACSYAGATSLLQASSGNGLVISTYNFLESASSVLSDGNVAITLQEDVVWPGASVLKALQSVGNLSVPVSFSPNPSRDLVFNGTTYRFGLIDMDLNGAHPFTTTTNMSGPSKRFVIRDLEASEYESTVPSCSPGYYALYNNITGIYTCNGCPAGSYCLGVDGIERLCSDGPAGRVTYTTPLQANSSCPYVCSVPGQCRSGDDCVNPLPKTFCANGTLANCSSPDFPLLWSFTANCTASMTWSALIEPSSMPNTSCQPSSNSTWCSLTGTPSNDLVLSFSLLFDRLPTSPSTLSVQLLSFPNQWSVSCLVNPGSETVLLQMDVATGASASSYLSNSVTLAIDMWYDVVIQVSSRNFLLMDINKQPVYYSFYDSAPPASVSNNTGIVLLGSYVSGDLEYSVSSLTLSNSNVTMWPAFASSAPGNLSSLFCDLSSSSLLSDGRCVPLCPSGQSRMVLPAGESLCVCNTYGGCDASSTTTSGCASGAYMNWHGKYLAVRVEQGSGFVAGIAVQDFNGMPVVVSSCGDLGSLSLHCEGALVDLPFGGWHVTSGLSAIFFLAQESIISSLSFAVRSDFTSLATAPLRFSLWLSSSLDDVLYLSSEAVVTNSWQLFSDASLDPPSELQWATINPSLAIFLQQQASAASLPWSSLESCTMCPNGTVLSLPPALNLHDCVCSNGVVPSRSGCDAMPSTHCPSSNLIVPTLESGLYLPPISVSFFLQNTTEYSPLVDIVITSDSSQLVSHVSLALNESIFLSESSTLTYSTAIPGCPYSERNIVHFLLKAACPSPILVTELIGSEGLVSIVASPGLVVLIAIDSESVSPLSTPTFNVYSTPLTVQQSSLIRARTVSRDSSCSPSAIVSGVVSLSAPVAPTTPASCGAACIGVICATVVMGFIVIVTACVLAFRGPLKSRTHVRLR